MWNSVGIVRAYSSEDENSIDIEFHDSTVHHAMHVSNHLNNTMADMSSEAIVLACEEEAGEEGEEKTPRYERFYPRRK